MKNDRSYRLLLPLAILVALAVHGATVPFTFEGTYDAFVHMFFADHYSRDWFEPWDERWYTGFTITSYPPLVHQVIALLSPYIGLKAGFVVWALLATVLFVRGVYVFSSIWVDRRSAGMAAIIAAFATSFVQALHIFGQLPSITGVAFLLNACYELYRWLRYGEKLRVLSALLLIAVTSTAHHVTTIFGTVFFIMPVIWTALYQRICSESGTAELTLPVFLKHVIRYIPRLAAFGFMVILITATVIFPYWYWSRTDPITQVPIPHGSRDSFIEVLSSGLMFFLIPWGVFLFILPFIFRQILRKERIILGLSVALLFILGTGGTTPIPRMILGETAFEILTLDRFTYWATLLILPFAGLFITSAMGGSQTKSRSALKVIVPTLLIAGAIATIFFQRVIKIQPRKIEVEPIVNFLATDKHDDWRYLTLGFGDQMAWLSANTTALTVDGNYHSARRLPELTSRSVERLENAKYLGNDGLKSLQSFLTNPDKYHLKYIFSNDRFYDPSLYFYGWTRIVLLENDIAVWERGDVPSLPTQRPKKTIPKYQRLMWGIIPLSTLLLCVIGVAGVYGRYSATPSIEVNNESSRSVSGPNNWDLLWSGILLITVASSGYTLYIKNKTHATPENVIHHYYASLDFKKFENAYAVLDPETRPTFQEFMTDQTLDGGILSSYAKLDTLEVFQEDSNAYRVNLAWLTSLKQYEVSHSHKMHDRNGKWYIEYTPRDPFIPHDQFVTTPGVDFHNQGRRELGVVSTSKRDILDRPDITVLEANLVQFNDHLAIVGKLMNVDNDPAYVVASGLLYTSDQKEPLNGNVKDLMKQTLYPKEVTSFRIDIESQDSSAVTIDSILATQLSVRSVVAQQAPYVSIGSSVTDCTDGTISGRFFNYGSTQILIPQLIFTHTSTKGDIVWVESDYLPSGIRPNRSQDYVFTPIPSQHVKRIRSLRGNEIIINGSNVSTTDTIHFYHPVSNKEVIECNITVDINALPASVYDIER